MDRTLNDIVVFEESELATTMGPTQLGDLELALVGGGIGDTTL